MKFCGNCNSLIHEDDIRIDHDRECGLTYGKCPYCGSDDIVEGCRCEVCDEAMEEESIHICPDCIEKLTAKWKEFTNSISETELEYIIENLL